MEISYILAKLLQYIQIPQIHKSKIDKSSKVRFKCLVVNSYIGKNTYISENTTIINCTIGSYTSIACNCSIGAANHPIYWMSTSPVFQNCKSILKNKINPINYNPYKETRIGNDVWIGSNVLIKSGVNIADGAVIGMGSVVTKDVGPYEVWAGNPAKMIKKRFDNNTIEKLLSSKWWDLKEYEIRRIIKDASNVEKILEGFEK